MLRLEARNAEVPIEKKPPWIKTRLRTGPAYTELKGLVRAEGLHTVCEEAGCPNIFECWEDREATFLIGGDQCTRRCDFCQIDTGRPEPLDAGEPRRVAESVAAMGLRYATVTGVARDDLPDGGAWLYAQTVREIHRAVPGCGVELLAPDFNADPAQLAEVFGSAPEVLAHNLETVPRIFRRIRPGFRYERSLDVLRAARDAGLVTKSNLILGLGEESDEVTAAMRDLRAAGCDLLTITQYLRPSARHHPVERWVKPAEFASLQDEALALGFAGVMSGPLVRSSYRAGRLYAQAVLARAATGQATLLSRPPAHRRALSASRGSGALPGKARPRSASSSLGRSTQSIGRGRACGRAGPRHREHGGAVTRPWRGTVTGRGGGNRMLPGVGTRSVRKADPVVDKHSAEDLQKAGRLKQIRMVASLVNQSDKKALPITIGSGAGVLVAAVAAGLLTGTAAFLIPLGVLGAMLTIMILFGRYAQAAQYRAVEGQPGAAAAVLQSMRGNWTVTPAVNGNRNLDVIHRAVGRPGVVLVGEGVPARVAGLLAAEKKKTARVAFDVPIFEFQVGNDEGQIPVSKLQKKVMRLPRNLRPAAVSDLNHRLRALQPTLAMPKGPLPKNARQPRMPRPR
jgi:lipoyl synthase